MATKLGQVVIYHEMLHLIKLLDPLVTYLCEATWHISTYTRAMTTNMARAWFTVRSFYPKIYITHLTNWKYYISTITMLMIARLIRNVTYSKGLRFHKFSWPLNELVMWGHFTVWIDYISTGRRLINTKLTEEGYHH